MESPTTTFRSVELFAGAGGLGLGLSRAGFKPAAVIEWDRYCCDTIRENQTLPHIKDWPLIEGDVSLYDFKGLRSDGEIDLISGGPPCQPFSLGGKHRGFLDERDMFPQAIRAVRELQPKAFVFENVKGLTRATFSNYFEYIRLQLTYPEIQNRVAEEWLSHLERLERHHTSGKGRAVSYRVVTRLLNAADYGVPQRRERIFFVGFRADLNIDWNFPEQTHSQDDLLQSQASGEYWDRHRVSKKDRVLSPRLNSRSLRLALDQRRLPWQTVRDAISDLPDPEKNSKKIHNHKFQPGARTYPGHTGSPLDEPAKTLKAGDHGVPGGENMLLRPDGSVRYFTVRESARLQTFPDNFMFHGSWTETMRQLGNAVPVELAETVARSVHSELCNRNVIRMKKHAA